MENRLASNHFKWFNTESLLNQNKHSDGTHQIDYIAGVLVAAATATATGVVLCDGATASQMPHLAHPMITCYFR